MSTAKATDTESAVIWECFIEAETGTGTRIKNSLSAG